VRARNAYRRLTGRAATADIARVRQRLDRIADRVGKAEAAARATAKEAEFHVREVNRIAPQLSALEAKVEDLRQELGTRPDRVTGNLGTARSLVEEIRTEHARIRVRLSALTTYEERLRRIEEKLGLPHD
jgi:chromosome segregation ATPase